MASIITQQPKISANTEAKNSSNKLNMSNVLGLTQGLMRRASEKMKGRGKVQKDASVNLVEELTHQQQTCPDHNTPGSKNITLQMYSGLHKHRDCKGLCFFPSYILAS